MQIFNKSGNILNAHVAAFLSSDYVFLFFGVFLMKNLKRMSSMWSLDIVFGVRVDQLFSRAV